jgi:CDP-diglyceride synthetase
LGWLFYGILFSDIYPSNGEENLLFVFLGCLVYAVFLSFVFLKWANISTLISGAKAGAIIAFFTSISTNLFLMSNKVMAPENFMIDVAIMIVCGAIVGGIIAFIIGKTKATS